MVNITKFAVRRPITVMLRLITIAYFGVQSLLGIKLGLTPEIEMPMLVTVTVCTEASPEDVNNLITVKQGNAISALDGVDTIQSCSQENVAVVLIQYEYGTDMDMAYIDFKKAIDGIRSDTSDDVRKPSIMELDMNSRPVVVLAVSEAMDGNLYTYVDEKLVPEFEKLSSVGEASIPGGQREHARMGLTPKKPEQYHLSISIVAQLVETADFTIPVGNINVGE